MQRSRSKPSRHAQERKLLAKDKAEEDIEERLNRPLPHRLTSGNRSKRKQSEEASSSSSDDEDDEDEAGDNFEAKDEKAGGTTATSSSGGVGGDGESDQNEWYLKMKREKRLAMNRASARSRRKRKKLLLVHLGDQVTELTKQNQELESKNELLVTRVQQLENALAQARATLSAFAAQSQMETFFAVGGGGATASVAAPSTAVNTVVTNTAGGIQTINKDENTLLSRLLSALPSLNPQGGGSSATATLQSLLGGGASGDAGGGAVAAPSSVTCNTTGTTAGINQDFIRSLLGVATAALQGANHPHPQQTGVADTSTLANVQSLLLEAQRLGGANNNPTAAVWQLLQNLQQNSNSTGQLHQQSQQLLGDIVRLGSFLQNNNNNDSNRDGNSNSNSMIPNILGFAASNTPNASLFRGNRVTGDVCTMIDRNKRSANPPTSGSSSTNRIFPAWNKDDGKNRKRAQREDE